MLFKDLKVGEIFFVPPDLITPYKKEETYKTGCKCNWHNRTNMLNGVKDLIGEEVEIKARDEK
jgi:hypothetical protein